MMCDIDGVIQTDDWKVTGTVDRHEPGLITFTTHEFRVRDKIRTASKTGRLAYRLPHGLSIPLASGDPIAIMHDHDTNAKRLEWDFHLSSGNKLILATTHQHDDTPPRSADQAEVLFDGAPGGHLIFFWSNPGTNDLDQNLTEVGTIHSPVFIRYRDDDQSKEALAAKDGITKVTLDGTNYNFVVIASEHSENEDHHDEGDRQSKAGSSDNLSHHLECILIRATPENRQ
ncbi:MAG: hypothetical protein KDB00_06630 [Planctomycetales bacterium]|nr:hypothetical protein [Planctomycetales bacterium]